MSSKYIIENEPDLTGSSENISRKPERKIKNISTKKVPNLTDKIDRKRRVTATYLRSKRLWFNSGDEIQDWLESE
jgi:hypothetical protein